MAVAYTPEEDALLWMYAKGQVSLSDLVQLTKRTATSLCGRAHKLGATRRTWAHRVTPRWDRLDEAVKQQVRDQVARGMKSLEEMARDTGVPRACLAEGLRSEGVDLLARKGLKISQASLGKKCPREKTRPTLTAGESEVATEWFRQGIRTQEIASRLKCRQPLVRAALERAGVDVKKVGQQRAKAAWRLSFLNGDVKISPNAGRGCRVSGHTPFQGAVVFRSRTEALRAAELDAEGKAWFYELCRYPLGSTTYTPDFWVTPVPLAAAKVALGETPTRADIQEFLRKHSYYLEDVKGWWGPRHGSWDKIAAFRKCFPQETFRILILDPPRGRRQWA